MKTLTIFIVLCFFTAFVSNTSNGQSRVTKNIIAAQTFYQYIPCTGDYLKGEISATEWDMAHHFVYRIRNASWPGYKDEACTIPSGNVYELSQTMTGWDNGENTATFKLDGKNIANFKFMIRTITNANGEVTAEIFVFDFICH
jgi:hypothetical protein